MAPDLRFQKEGPSKLQEVRGAGLDSFARHLCTIAIGTIPIILPRFFLRGVSEAYQW